MTDKIDVLVATYPHIWKTRSAVFSYLRGGIRRALWNRCPQKVEFIKENRIKIPNPNPRGKVKQVWGGVCSVTGEVLPLNMLNVDHISGNNSLSELSDLQSFIESIALVTKQDLQFISVVAHKVKNHAEKQGISFEEAMMEKKAIELAKSKQDKQWLLDKGVTPANNQAARRIQIIQELNNGKD